MNAAFKPGISFLTCRAPPSPEELLRRLQGRNTDSPEEIARRQQCLQDELAQEIYYDHVVVNDVVADTVLKIRQIVSGR